MHVLYFLKRFPKLSESFVLYEIHELLRRGHEVSVFALNDPGESIQHEEFGSLDVTVRYADRPTVADVSGLLSPKLFTPRVLAQSLYRDHPKHHGKALHRARQCIDFVDDLATPIDHIHCHFGYRDKIAATYVAAYHRVSCTVTAHAYELFADPDPHALGVLFDRTDRVVVPSQYNRSYLREHFGVTKPIDVVPATTLVSKFEPTDEEVPNRLLTVARLVEKKGIVHAIEALPHLIDTYPDLEYHVVGTGELADDLRERAADLGVTENVTFLGHVDDDRLHREYDEAAAFVLPCVIASDGDRDAMPVVLKEAMAMKTACVSTMVSAVPELIVDGENGLLVEPHDPAGLATAIDTILDDDRRRAEMGRHARETIRENYSIEAAVDKLLDSFRSAMSQQA